MLRKILGFGVLGLLACAACTGGVSLGQANGPLGAGNADKDGGSGLNGNVGTPSGPYDVECTFYHRPSPAAEFEEQKFTAKSDGTAQKTITFSGYTFDLDFGPATDAATDAILSVKARERDVVQQYRLAKDTRPADQFAGGHGFTGLVYLAQEMQYTCGAPGASAPPSGSEAVPFDIACQVELRATPGGAIEKSQILELKTGGTQTFTEGDYSVAVTIFDDASEGRGMFVDAKKGAGDYATHQLLQINRNAAIANQLAGTTFTGRFAIGTGTNKELSYACSARSQGGSTPGLGELCGVDKSCPTGSSCAIVPELDPSGAARCYAGDVCQRLNCGARGCVSRESYPAQVSCGK